MEMMAVRHGKLTVQASNSSKLSLDVQIKNGRLVLEDGKDLEEAVDGFVKACIEELVVERRSLRRQYKEALEKGHSVSAIRQKYLENTRNLEVADPYNKELDISVSGKPYVGWGGD